MGLTKLLGGFSMQTKMITRTAMLLALTLVFQIGFRQFAQPVVGPLVNMMLLISVLLVGLPSALMIGILTPMIAFVAGIIGVFPLIPMIIAGNMLYILAFGWVRTKLSFKFKDYVSVLLAAVVKFLFLYAAVRTILPLMIVEVKPPVIATFSLPQLYTALIGGVLALIVYNMLPFRKEVER